MSDPVSDPMSEIDEDGDGAEGAAAPPEANGAAKAREGAGSPHRAGASAVVDDRAARRSPKIDKPKPPKLYETDAGILLLGDVSSVQCYSLPKGGGVCQVVLRSGVSLHIDLQYSRGLIDALKAHHADGSVVRSVERVERTA